MMTDKELLEMAAKAAGMGYAPFSPKNGYDWNPLNDDGDALRLAVKLRLNLNFEEFDGVEYACVVPSKSHQGYDEPMGDDRAADTRRAIVRAAAEIGRKSI